MKNEKEIKKEIQKTTKENENILESGPATFEVNSPRAAIQIAVTTKLDTLYWVIGKKRPKFTCDNYKKSNM